MTALREHKLAYPKGPLDLVFPNGAGNVENLTNIVARGLKPAMIAADVVTENGKAKYAGMHALRHFYTSWYPHRWRSGIPAQAGFDAARPRHDRVDGGPLWPLDSARR